MCWLSPLKLFMAWVQAISGTVSPYVCANPTHVSRRGILQISWKFWLIGSRKRNISALWKIVPLEMRSTPTLLAFLKGSKTWFYQLAWDPNVAFWIRQHPTSSLFTLCFLPPHLAQFKFSWILNSISLFIVLMFFYGIFIEWSKPLRVAFDEISSI